jgi:antitoxin HigA-1
MPNLLIIRITTRGIAMSRMHDPAHPGEVLREWLPASMSITQAAKELQFSRVTLSKILNGKAGITAGMALRLIS